MLNDYRRELAAEHRCELLAVPTPTMNFGCLHGGDSPNRICGELDFSFDVRMVPGLDYADIEQTLNQRLGQLGQDHGIEIGMRRLVEPVPAFEQPAGSAGVAAAEDASGIDVIKRLIGHHCH